MARRSAHGPVNGLHTSMRVCGATRSFLWCAVLTALILVSVAEAAMTFTTPNVVQASMYQTVRLSIQSNIATADPPVVSGDRVYFYDASSGATCTYTAAGTTPQTTFNVTATASSGGYTGTVVVPILSSIFAVGTSYSVCYLSTSLESATIMMRPTSVNGSTGLLIWPPLYTTYGLSPAAPTGSEGVVNLTINEVVQAGRPLNQALTGSNTIFLVPCAIVAPTAGLCTDLNTLTQACATVGSDGASTTSGVVSLFGLRGQGTTTAITGGFTVPYSPDAGGYAMCVPYCADTTSCTSSRTLSFTFVAASPSPLLNFGAARPGTYTRSPAAPQARELGYMYFTGTDLTTADDVRVIRADQSCTSSTASLLTNLQVGAVEVATGEGGSQGATMQASFIAPELLSAPMVGKVCYRRAASGLWSSVYLAVANAPNGDFTVDVLQPSSFTVSPANPVLGEVLQLTFSGTGLSASADSAFLSISSATDPCDTTALQAGQRFNCTMSATGGGGDGSPTCTVVVDPPAINQGLQAAVCYQKVGGFNYATLAAAVTLADRNPVYAISPYPLYAGEVAVITFTGTSLSLNDEVKFIAAGERCDTASAIAGVEVRAGTEVTSGTTYNYTFVGAATLCLDICYRFAGAAEYTVARAQTALPAVSSTCAAQQVYIASFPVRYTMANLGSALTAMETATMRFTSTTGASLSGTTIAPTAVKLVQSADNCVLASCTGLTACERDAQDTYYVSAITAATTSATVWLSLANANVIVCVLNAASGTSYVPVLPLTATSPTATTYGLVAAARRVVLGEINPSPWRVRLATLGASLLAASGGLNASADSVYAVNSTGVTTVVGSNAVCALPGSTATISSPLVSRLNTTTSTASNVNAVFTRGDRLTSGAVMYVCYQWTDISGTPRISFAGTTNIAPAIPTSATPVGTPSAGYSAGLPVTVRFSETDPTAGSAVLLPTVDTVFFYRYVQSSNPTPNCYCDPVTCASGTYISYGESAGFTTSVAANTLDYYAPLGFDNYDFRAIYHVCYSSSTAGGVSYMGRLDVRMANPTFYSVSSVAGTVNRVGAPITVTAVRRCLSAGCTALSVNDVMMLVPSTSNCADLTNTSTLDSIVQVISTTVPTGGVTYMRRFVVDVVGEYRVCYRLAAETSFHELVFSADVVRQTLSVIDANPSAFTTTPGAPTAGQFLELQLTCTDSLCSSCTTIRLIPGTRASCWSDIVVAGTYSSDSCLTASRIQFPDQFIVAGSYTVCYSSNTATSRRIPSVFTVAAANPVNYMSASASVDIYTNQASDFVIDITGTGLTVSDDVFLLPALGYTCHDLRTDEIQSNGTLASWLAPSVDPYPLTATSTGVRWIVSNQGKRFGAGLLDDISLCGASGATGCTMQLCYRRAGTTWGPVSVAAPPPLQVVPSNPSSAAFDNYPLFESLYTMITVQGIGLNVSATVRVHVGSCSGAVVTTSTVTPVVNAAATEWVGVLRFNGTTPADTSYAVCYWQLLDDGTSSASEIVSFTLPDGTTTESVLIFPTPLYYVLSPANFSSAQYRPSRYEELIVGGTFYEAGGVNVALTAATLIDGDTDVAECDYAPFYAATGSTEAHPPVLDVMSPVTANGTDFYQARLVRSQFIAMCLQSSVYGLFRVSSSPPSAVRVADDSNALWIQEANPMTFTSRPSNPNPGQNITLTFTVSTATSSLSPATNITPLAVGDTVQVILESRYRCGFPNATVVAEGLVDSVNTTGTPTASASMLLSSTVDLSALTVGGNVTVCYRKQSGTFATTPRDGLVEYNLHLLPQIPAQWASSPSQVQVNGAAVIEFFGNSIEPNFLEADDYVYLIKATDLVASRATMTTVEMCLTETPVLKSTSLVMDGVNTRWNIPTNTLRDAGVYMFCYVSVKNGAVVDVALPSLFQVFAAVSPYGAYTNKGDVLTVSQGERFYLFFNSSEVLDVVLDDGTQTAADLEGRDVVTLSPTSTCESPLTSTNITAIPDAFGYRPVTPIDPISGLAVPSLHLRVRANVGRYFICMRRANRESWQVYYTAEVVGAGVGNAAVLVVEAAPLTSFLASPVAPRVGAANTSVTLTLAPTLTATDLAQVFFVPFNGSSTTAADEMLYDDCYRPATAAEAESAEVVLVNTTLQVDLATLLTTYAFPSSGPYLMCYQLAASGAFIASVFPTALTVNRASPIAYVVPSAVSVQNVFALGLTYVDAIFNSGNANTLHIYVYQGTDLELTPSCKEGEVVPPSAGSIASFTAFTVVNTSYASVQPLIMTAGYYYVCFLTFDQTQYVPVPNLLAGGFVFPVGLTGAQSYTASPQPAYLGQQVHLTINGNTLSNADHAKVVDVTALAEAGSSFVGVCTADAVNADAAEAKGAAGSTMNNTNGIVAHYYPRLNSTGTFVLCYQSAAAGNQWVYISTITSFAVGAAHPSSYAQWPDPTFETEVAYLYVTDTSSLLSAGDGIKLVARGSGTRGFDCTDAAVQSSTVGALVYDSAASNASVAVYRLCGTTASQVTVCYRLASSPAWAEVPLSSPTTTPGAGTTVTYVFAPATFAADPFTGPVLTTTSGLAPRPYEPFTAAFTSATAGVTVTYMGFSMAPRNVCALTVDYVAPIDYRRNSTAASTFALALPRAGTYVVHLGSRDNVIDPNITHTTTLTIASCDPCSLAPDYTFVGNTVTVTFPSTTGSSLATGDAMRLIPTSQGVTGTPCDTPTGPYATTTFSPTAVGAGGSSTSFLVTAGTQAESALYLGEYYVCYRKAQTAGSSSTEVGQFAIVADNNGVPASFSIYPTDVVIATACPASNQVYGLEAAELTVTMRDAAMYPNAAFSTRDECVLVPDSALTTGSCEELTSEDASGGATAGLLRLALSRITKDAAVWNVTLPRLTTAITYNACYRLAEDTLFRDVMASGLVVQPANPLSMTYSPPVVVPESINVRVNIRGTGLQAGDDVYVVGEGVSCAETCSNAPLTPQTWIGTSYTRVLDNSSSVTLKFDGPINQQTTLGICYRRVGAYLTRVGNLLIGEPNPISYTTDFVPRVGTRPTLTFFGENLTRTDALMIVPPDAECVISNAVASGSFTSIATNATWTTFFLPLNTTGVVAANYTVCYQVATVGAYSVVQPLLPVRPGGPSSFAASNRPMRGRALTLTFPSTSTSTYTVQVGDSVFIACPSCSCFDGDSGVPAVVEAARADVPYGVVSATATAETVATFGLHFGLNDTATYPVCYKVFDSGFATVGRTSSTTPPTDEPVTALTRLVPVDNSPALVDVFPLPTYQGQRLTYNFTNFSTIVPLANGDEVMLVQATRTCWENETRDATNIVVTPSAATVVAGTAAATALARWDAHVPSLGPDTPAASLFPLNYALCYRQAGQPEYVAVPYPIDTATPDTLSAADPSTFTTDPATLETGMLGITVTFPGSAEGDQAYLVGFDTLTNTVCTDASATVLSAQATAWPTYAMQIPGDATVSASNAALCYIKSGATVAEVPQFVAITAGNPYNYTTNVTTIAPTAETRERQYIAFTVLGSGLDAAADAVAFTESPCGSVPMPITSSPLLARLGDRSANAAGTELYFVAQFIAPSSPVSMYMCYRRGGVWRGVGATLVLQAPQPSAGELFSVSGASSTPRAGQHLYIALIDGPGETAPAEVAVISADNTLPSSWCHNFTSADVREPYLRIANAGLLDVPVWERPGQARVCLRYPDTIWSDVAATVEAASAYEVMPANPGSLAPFPEPPRVGQRVTLTFFGVVSPSAGDVVKITEPDNTVPCETAEAVPGLTDVAAVIVRDTSRTVVTLTDSTDPLLYRSFNRTGTFRVCYYSQAENAWGVVGGTLAAGSFTVEEKVPQAWSLVDGNPVMSQPFRIQFTDTLGLLNVSGDRAWAVPSGLSCAVDPVRMACPGCIEFAFNQTASSVNAVVTTEAVSVVVDNMSLCYALYNATPAVVDGTLNVTSGPIQCVEQDTVIIGQQQTVTFRIEEGVDVSADAWRVSFYATTQSDCSARYMDAFAPGRAVQTTVTPTSVSYALEWPVELTNSSYTICYAHNGIVGPVCTCGQIDSRTGECFIQTSPGSPSAFVPSPTPTYVGQTITLTFTVLPTMVLYPPTAVKLVKYVDALTTCADAPAFAIPATPPVALNSTHFTYSFKHDYALGSATLLVCAMTDLSPDYARVGNARLNNTLWIRPYMTVKTFPSLPQYVRAMQTLSTAFKHQSRRADDVVSLADEITIVADPYNCVESYIDSQDPASVMSMLVLDDTAFLTVPAPVRTADAAAFETTTLLTFNTSGVGTHYMCYRLAAGTWAPVLPALAIMDVVVDKCSLNAAASGSNGYDGLAIRAMQYVPLELFSSNGVLSILYSTADQVRIVPQGELCGSDSSTVFTSGTTADATATRVNTIWFAPAGSTTYKLCYRFVSATNGTAMTNWSPTCTHIGTTEASPVGKFVGCFNRGQALDVTATQQGTYVYAAGDAFRYIMGDCLTVTGATVASGSITVNDTAQAATGLALTAAEAGRAVFDVPYAVLGAGTTRVRLCYTDAAGNQFAVPLDYAARPTVSAMTVNGRQPASVAYQGTLQLGQRLRLNYTAATVTNAATGTTSLLTTPPLTPYALTPHPLVPGIAFDNTTFDGATLWSLGTAATVYRDGRCTAAARAAASASPSSVNPLGLRGVYGPVLQSVPYTIGVYDPTVAAYYISCYQTPTCGVSDVGTPVRVLPYNPSNVQVNVPRPRRGQLLDVIYSRDTTSGSSVPLTPGADRGAKQANLASCWTLADDAGSLVTGTTETTQFTTILYAQPPGAASTTTTRSCYRLSQSAWSEVPNGVGEVLAANPAFFASSPSRRFTANQLTFTGANFSLGDVAKIIPLSLNCSDTFAPPSSISAYAADGSFLPSSSAGWPVGTVSADGTSAALNFTATETGTFSVCYRLATDTVWTLVYSNLIIGERDPATMTQTPVSTLEGELFTLNFTSTDPSSTLSVNDYVALYYGTDVNCMHPSDNASAPAITAAPSRSELPGSIAFQMAAGTRGSYTVCYFNAQGTNGVFLPSWGFSVVLVEPNPRAMQVFPNITVSADVTARRHEELITLLFEGWGLVSTSAKFDQVRLVSAATLPREDASCEAVNAATDVVLYPLYANGTYASQVFRATGTPALSVSYWVCYKLNGGQFHVLDGEAVTVSAAADPSGATETNNKLAGSVQNGEQLTWSLTRSAAPADCSAADVVFYSRTLCNDVPYYTARESVTVEYFAALGAAPVTCGAASTAVRIGTYAPAPTTLSLCYWHNSSHTVSVVPGAAETITVAAGVPPPLSTSLTTPAQQIFEFELQVAPTATDYVVLVKDPNSCVGWTAPANDAYFTNATYNATSGAVEVTAALPSAGLYYVCYSHSANPSVEHARIVGVVEATSANPQGWRVTPTPLYQNDTNVRVSFQFADAASAAGQSAATAWLVQLTPNASETNALSMLQVATSCMSAAPDSPQGVAQREAGTAIDLTFNATTSSWAPSAAGALSRAGRFALCYNAGSATTRAFLSTYPTIFGPVANAGPVVLPSTITAVRFTEAPVLVGQDAVAIAQGGGLSQGDALVAVALPAEVTTAPADVCTNMSYTPRVPSTADTSTGSSTTQVRRFMFSTAGAYVLCYESAASIAGTDASGPQLVSDTPFTVFPSVVSVQVVGGALYVGTPANFAFNGSDLRVTDEAALVFVGNLTNEEATSVTVVCDATTVVYTAMTSASADGSNAIFTTTPAVAGEHAMCYRRGQTTNLLAPRFTARVQTVVSAAFTVQPGGCQEYYACLSQPVVTTLNSSALPAADPSAAVALTLLDAATGAVVTNGALSGDTLYTTSADGSAFTFVAASVTTAGTYQLLATVTLSGGATAVKATSASFTVTESGGGTTAIANMSCTPAGVLPTATTPVVCTMAALTATGPSNYTVQVSSGTATACVSTNATTSDGYPTCTFTVTPPAPSTTTIPTNYIIIAATPAAPYATWPVANSPAVVWLPSVPEASSVLSCARNASSGSALPAVNLVRVGESLACTAQPRVTRGGVATDVAALPSALRAAYFVNDDAAAATPIALSPTPSTMTGAFAFSVLVASGRRLSVTAEVDVDSRPTTVAWQSMTNSPQTFTVLGVPTAAASALRCNATRTGSLVWYTLAEPLQCQLSLADATGAVNGLISDYSAQMPQGGGVQFVDASTVYGTTLALVGVAPSQATAASVSSEAAVQTSVETVARAAVSPRASSFDDAFTVVVSTPATTASVLASYGGTLVYVRTVGAVPTLTAGRTATLTFIGSGLDTTHTYLIMDSEQCNSTVSTVATAAAGTTVGELQLTFVTPFVTNLYVCFKPADASATAPSQLLLSRAFVTASSGGGGSSSWTSDDLVLLIVGVVFLFILLVLLVLLLWRICCFGGLTSSSKRRTRRHTESHTRTTVQSRVGARQETDVYMPPRANDRFVYRAAVAQSDVATPTSTPTPVPAPQAAALVPQAPSSEEMKNPPPQSQLSPQPDAINVRVTTRSTVQPQPQAVQAPAPAPLPAPAPSTSAPPAVHTDPSSSSYTTTTTTTTRASSRTGDGPHRKRHHHHHRRPRSSSAHDDADETVSITSSRHRAHAAALTAPPVPPRPVSGGAPPPAATSTAPLPGGLPDLVETPRVLPQPPSETVVATTPPPHIALPAVPSGPYQHLHHGGSRRSTPNATPTIPPMPVVAPPSQPSASAHSSPLFSPAEGTGEDGAYTVTGHTSRPMVRSRSKR